LATAAKTPSIFFCTAGDSTPAGALKTIRAVSPDWAGNLVSSRLKASWESEAGSLNSSLKSEPALPAIIPTPIRATIQAKITVLRWPVHQVAKARIRGHASNAEWRLSPTISDGG
jgi:hypothetical protein